MTRPIKQIEADLAMLAATVATVAEEISSAYEQYFQLLGESVQRQIALASYQICTQAYPDSFLSLSYHQRRQLQQSLRQLGKQVPPQLKVVLETSQKGDLDLAKFPEATTDEEILETAPETTSNETEQTEEKSALEASESENLTPENLIAQIAQLEAAIAQILQTASGEVNRLLQQASILPKKLPNKILEAAVQAEESTDAIGGGQPNLLKLVVETETPESAKDAQVTQLMAVCLRLAEIEFNAPALSAQRNQIRELQAQVAKLQKQYSQRHRERSIAQAEAAWRSCWYED
ncbi:MAG: hypothetical protein SAJ37_23685 [Oscillatoria sp. PMC 1068.18]|nr:hypothetical protein [Oscillatoria sp. PMC 1076.18]MEC4991749.1 hypothetical protein [Oscillatoria sp. PMC 1068.18]